MYMYIYTCISRSHPSKLLTVYKCDMYTLVWYLYCVVGLWFIKLYKHDFEVMKSLVMSCPLVQYQAYNHLPLQPEALWLDDT